MSDRTKTPPETPAAKTEHDKWIDEQLKHGGDIIDMRGMTGAQQDRALIEAQIARIKEDTSQIVALAPATPNEARYHTFEFVASTKQLTKHPPDWYDGKPKRCPGSGLPPGVQYHGEVSDDGEPKYLCRCPWCDRPHRPGPMPEHTFIPVRAEDITFTEGRTLIGVEQDPPLFPLLRPDDAGVVSFTVNHEACPACGHQHGGAEVGFICIGCPCSARPAVDWNAQRAHGEPPLCDGCKQLRAQSIAEGRAGFVLCSACLAARSCDGNHGDPPCASEQCHLKDPPIFTVEARVRRVGDHIELLCGACELPLSTEESVYVGDDEDEFQEHAFVWHISCKQAEPAE